jgi:hypothetical protein
MNNRLPVSYNILNKSIINLHNCLICDQSSFNDEYFIIINKKKFICCSHECLIKLKKIYNYLKNPQNNCIWCDNIVFNDNFYILFEDKKIYTCSNYCLFNLQNILNSLNL